jgi:hypothetical protein
VLLEREAVGLDEETFGPPVTVHRILDRPGAGVVVVRPDGYVGFRSASVDPRQIAGWLTLVAAAPHQHPGNVDALARGPT